MGIVYVVGTEESRFLKIGRTDNLKRRIQALNTSSSSPIEVIATIDESVIRERHLHAVFAPYRKHGEWFDVKRESVSSVLNDATRISSAVERLLALTTSQLNAFADMIHAETVEHVFASAVAIDNDVFEQLFKRAIMVPKQQHGGPRLNAGRPLKFGEQGRAVRISVSMPHYLVVWLNETARQTGRTRSSIVVEALERGLSQMEKERMIRQHGPQNPA